MIKSCTLVINYLISLYLNCFDNCEISKFNGLNRILNTKNHALMYLINICIIWYCHYNFEVNCKSLSRIILIRVYMHMLWPNLYQKQVLNPHLAMIYDIGSANTWFSMIVITETGFSPWNLCLTLKSRPNLSQYDRIDFGGCDVKKIYCSTPI